MKTLTVIGKGGDAKRLAGFLKCKMNDRKAQVGIRYGSKHMGHFPVMINADKAVAKASNKYYTLELLAGLDIPVPKFSTNSTCLKYPMLGRKFYHRKGRDIKVIRNSDELRNQQSDYYVEFIPVREEYRVHVVCGKIASIAIKRGGNPDTYCRNLETGWTFTESTWRWERDCKQMPEIAMKAVKALGLAFGAVDIIISQNDGKPYILEVNTAPGLIDRRAEIYANLIRTALEG